MGGDAFALRWRGDKAGRAEGETASTLNELLEEDTGPLDRCAARPTAGKGASLTPLRLAAGGRGDAGKAEFAVLTDAEVAPKVPPPRETPTSTSPGATRWQST